MTYNPTWGVGAANLSIPTPVAVPISSATLSQPNVEYNTVATIPADKWTLNRRFQIRVGGRVATIGAAGSHTVELVLKQAASGYIVPLTGAFYLETMGTLNVNWLVEMDLTITAVAAPNLTLRGSSRRRIGLDFLSGPVADRITTGANTHALAISTATDIMMAVKNSSGAAQTVQADTDHTSVLILG